MFQTEHEFFRYLFQRKIKITCNPNSTQHGHWCLITSDPRPLSSGENTLSAGAGLREVRQKVERTVTSFLCID